MSKLSQLAYDRFKQALWEGRLAPGASVSQGELVTLLGVSLASLREAMQVLEAEGLLRIQPRSGIRIVQPDLGLVKDLFQFRMILEQAGLRRFAEDCSTAELAELERVHMGLYDDVAAITDDATRLRRSVELDYLFHGRLIAALNNQVITGHYRRNRDRLRLGRIAPQVRGSVFMVRLTIQEHLKVIEALKVGDRDAAAKRLDEHLQTALHRAIGM